MSVCRSLEPLLSPRLEDSHGHGVGQIQAAVVGAHGQAQQVVGAQAVLYVVGQAGGLAAKDQAVAGQEAMVVGALWPLVLRPYKRPEKGICRALLCGGWLGATCGSEPNAAAMEACMLSRKAAQFLCTVMAVNS